MENLGLNMRILVTGHLGYIGSVLTPLLRRRGHIVLGLDTEYFGRCTFGPDSEPVPSVRKDIRDVVESDLDGIDAVIHLAGLSNDPLGDFRPELTREINEQGSIRLASLCSAHGIRRFLFASSCSCYGASGDAFVTEAAELSPLTPYGVSKANVEAAVLAMASGSFCPVFLRASTAYGASPRLRFDLVLNNLTAWAFTTGRVYIKSDGTPWRPVVHVEDIAAAYIAALEATADLVCGQAFNVGSTTENYRVRDLAEIVRELIPGTRIEYAPDAGPDKRCYRVDCNKIARTLPGFKPQWTTRRGVAELVDTYKRTGLTVEEFEGEKFKRIAHIQKLVREGALADSLRWKNSHG